MPGERAEAWAGHVRARAGVDDRVPTDGNQEAREALKRVAVTLKQAGVRFALAGGYAAWAHGAPEPAHDVDFVAQEDASKAEAVLMAEGLRVEHTPEDWLVN
jgi:hypothetical protein